MNFHTVTAITFKCPVCIYDNYSAADKTKFIHNIILMTNSKSMNVTDKLNDKLEGRSRLRTDTKTHAISTLTSAIGNLLSWTL